MEGLLLPADKLLTHLSDGQDSKSTEVVTAQACLYCVGRALACRKLVQWRASWMHYMLFAQHLARNTCVSTHCDVTQGSQSAALSH